jgi:long-chain acyl-CoA synthetase
MLGYWQDPAATAKVITPDGWLRTGDQAKLADGHIYITGRIKDILVLSNGEKVPPADLEMAILMDPLVEQVVVLGEGHAYLTAVLVLNAEQWPAFAREQGMDPERAESLRDAHLQRAVLQRIRLALHGFPGYAKVRRVTLSLEPWSIDNGLLTPTMKVKRAMVVDRYRRDIDAMFSMDADA